MTKNSNKINNNPLNNMDPISQINEFKENVKELDRNFKNIVRIASPMIKKGLILPCEISKKISESLCSISDQANDTFDKLNVGIKKIDINKFDNLLGGKDVTDTYETYSKKGRYFGRNRQDGGGKSNYNYIINPITKRRVKINGKKGREILQKYINE